MVTITVCAASLIAGSAATWYAWRHRRFARWWSGTCTVLAAAFAVLNALAGWWWWVLIYALIAALGAHWWWGSRSEAGTA